LLAALDCMAEHGAGSLVTAKRDRFACDVILDADAVTAMVTTANRVVSSGWNSRDRPPAFRRRRRRLRA